MADISSVELNHCRELALSPGSLFEFTSRFMQAGQLKPLLALYALKQAIGTIPQSPVDDAVKWAKLKWWSEELVADPALPSRHPVLRALRLSGARARLNNTLLLSLVSDAVKQVDIAPNRDENAMFDQFSATGMTEIQMELALDKAEVDTHNLDFLAAASGLFHWISGFAPGQRPETERLPMNILAKFNVSAAQLEGNSRPDELPLIMMQLAGLGLNWFSEGLSGLKISADKAPNIGAGTHLQLRWAMEERRLEGIRQDASGFLDTGYRYGPKDAWFAWRFLRGVKKFNAG